MAVTFRDVSFPPLAGLTVSAPDGALIGIVGDDGSGGRELLRLAAGLAFPMEGVVKTPDTRRFLDAASDLDLSPAGLLLLDHALSRRDAVTRARAAMDFVHLRRSGLTILLASHELDLLRSLADEIWWLDKGRLAAKGDPAEVLEKYRAHVADRVRALGAGRCSPLSPPIRRGDGRAELVSIETLNEHGEQTMTWRNGEAVAVRVTARYREAVDDPVIGIMIRTRIGFEVYGTNTELEKLKLGPCAAGTTLRVLFRFRCDLCPREYTLTAASHDPDGVLHEWLEDALAFLIVDSRFTAGVANLKAEVSVEGGT
jgi:energy-coupling factor transporter ATP-binding protein EcfA2